ILPAESRAILPAEYCRHALLRDGSPERDRSENFCAGPLESRRSRESGAERFTERRNCADPGTERLVSPGMQACEKRKRCDARERERRSAISARTRHGDVCAG